MGDSRPDERIETGRLVMADEPMAPYLPALCAAEPSSDNMHQARDWMLTPIRGIRWKWKRCFGEPINENDLLAFLTDQTGKPNPIVRQFTLRQVERLLNAELQRLGHSPEKLARELRGLAQAQEFSHATWEAELDLFRILFRDWMEPAIKEVAGLQPDAPVGVDAPHKNHVAYLAADAKYRQGSRSGDGRIADILRRAKREFRELTGIPVGLGTVEEWRVMAMAAGMTPAEFNRADVKTITQAVRAWVLAKKAQHHKPVEVTPAQQPATPDNLAGDGKPEGNGPGKNINGRMLDTLQRNHESRGWTARQWADRLDCSPSSIAETPTWKELSAARKVAKADRALSKHRRSVK